jgi:hypothetical protein
MSVYRNYPTEAPTAAHAPFMRQALRNGPDATQPSRPHEATLDWLATAERVGRHVDLDASAHALGAMLRRRGVPSATNLLCLAFLYGPGRMPLRLIAERAASFDIAHVSEPALLRRLLNAGHWLEHVASSLIQEQLLRAAKPQSPDPVSETSPVAPIRLPVDPYSIMSEQDNLTRQVEAARRFVVDFVPWPEDMFTDAQVHWLLCVRWTFVASTIKDGAANRADADPQSGPTLERTRMMAHLIAACISREA